MIKVKNIRTAKGNDALHQFGISGINRGTFKGENNEDLGSGRAFQSYHSMVVFIDYEGRVYLDKERWDYSVTTSKYRNLFLGETKKETAKKIKSGVYTLCDLNHGGIYL